MTTPAPVPPSALPETEPGSTPVVRGKRQKRKAYGKTARQGALWSVIRQGGHELIAVPSSMIMARLLSPEDFGIAAAASFFIVLAARLSQFGFSAAIVRIKDLRPEHTSSVFFINVIMGLVCYATIAGSAPWIGQLVRSSEAAALLPIAALTFLVTPFGAVPAALISRNMQFRYLALGDWTDQIAGAVAMIFLALRGWGYWSIACGNLAGVATRIALQAYLSGWRPSLRFSREAIRELLSFGLGVQSKRLLEYAAFNIDNLIVGRVLGMHALGVYDKAFSTMSRLANRLTLGQAPFRIFSLIHDDAERFRRAYGRLMLGVTLISYPAFAGVIVAAEPLFLVLYGEQWVAAVVPFQLLCAGGILKLLHAYASQANEAAGGIWLQVRRQAIGGVLVALGASIGSMWGGVAGAALGVSIALVLLSALMQALVRNALGLTWRDMALPHLPGLFYGIAVGATMYLVDLATGATIPEPAAWLRLGLMCGIGGFVYVALVLFSRSPSVREIVDETVEDLFPPRAARMFDTLRRFQRVPSTS